MIIKSLAAVSLQRDVLTTVGISAGTLAFIRTVQLESIAQALILAATLCFVLSRAALEVRKLVHAARVDRDARARRNRSRILTRPLRRRKARQ